MKKIKNYWQRIKIGNKLALGSFFLITGLLVGMVEAISYATANVVEKRVASDIESRTKIIIGMLDSVDIDLRKRSEVLAGSLRARLKRTIEVDPAMSMKIGEWETPMLQTSDGGINTDYTIVDEFTRETGTPASIAARVGDRFVVVSTSQKVKNKRIMGWMYPPESEVAKNMIAGKAFTKLEEFDGAQFVVNFEPLKDTKGSVIGMFMIAVDFSAYLTNVKESIRDMKIGKTGYFYVLDARHDTAGTLIVHPAQEGTNILDAKDADGHLFIKEIIEKKNGVITYPWMNAKLGDKAPRMKIVSYTSFPKWNWIVAGGSYVDEFTEEVTALRFSFFGIAAGVVLLISVCLYFFIRAMVAKPLSQASNVAKALAGGDLTVRFETKRQDEVGELAGSINEIGEGIAKVVKAVRSSADSIATSSSEIAQANSNLSDRTQNQASAIIETSASAEELGSTARQNAANAEEANTLAHDASNVAVAGGEVVGEMVESMSKISGSSRKIADIVQVIESIAFQTNILALNASVEAARAGDQGKGFAVVASEVRNLAGRSAQAAKEIGTLINASVDQIAEGEKLATKAGETMGQVVESISRVTTIMSEISSASAEQDSGVGQVAHAVAQMDIATQQNAALVEEMTAAATSMEAQSQDLVRTVQVFKV